jgi:predicted nuclease with TOPRIM domain
MPNQEEKITVLEDNITILLGIASGQERDIKSIQVGVMSLDRRFDALEGRLYGMDHRLSALEKRFEVQDQKLDQILFLLNTYIPKPDHGT